MSRLKFRKYLIINGGRWQIRTADPLRVEQVL